MLYKTYKGWTFKSERGERRVSNCSIKLRIEGSIYLFFSIYIKLGLTKWLLNKNNIDKSS